MGRRDDLVAWVESKPLHHDIDRVRAVGTTHAVIHPKSSRKLLLEERHVSATDERGFLDYLPDGPVDVLSDAEVLCVEIDEGNSLVYHGMSSVRET